MGVCGTVLYWLVRGGTVLCCALVRHRTAVILTVVDLGCMERLYSVEYVRGDFHVISSTLTTSRQHALSVDREGGTRKGQGTLIGQVTPAVTPKHT